ncbi:cytochrome P450 [Novosphingobium sp. KCTC 2891]|uniref:cytochrome P450 n=1 Tax=Novosphingobium sp. KCTC 2891 TaxID=2989730 RepID=UPI00222371F7|nr:cytochrome P450 [Novosphingobium sp. KCTC 2891]MCW1384682.1 cytochrome P450 [Novosphingobium sp. KCTC 2891]
MTSEVLEFEPAGASHDELYGSLAEIRQQHPIFFSEKHGGWVITRYDDLATVAKSPNFTVENALQGAQGGQYCPAAMDVLATGVDWTKTRHIQTDDGPDHARFRRAMTSVITPKRIREMAPVVQHTVDDLIDKFIARGSCEYVSEFAYPLAMLTTLNLIGFTEAEDDMSMFPRWVDDTFRMLLAELSEDEQVAAAKNAVAFQHYIRDKIAARQADPRDDLLSEILGFLSGEAALSMDELVIMFTHSFVGAGNETTKLALTNTIYHMLSKRERWEQMLANQDKVSAFVEEGLRYEAPLLAWYRYCAADSEVGGQLIRKGDKVIILFGSANHDPAKFSNPDEFCPFRADQSAIMTFNTGKHFCVGAPLARLELNAALATLAKRLPGLRLKPGQDIAYAPTFANRAIPELYLEWDV